MTEIKSVWNRTSRTFRKHGLISHREIEARNDAKFRVLTLTKDGKRFLQHQNRVPKSQALYDGLVKPKELAHDSELYRLSQKVASEVEYSGGASGAWYWTMN